MRSCQTILPKIFSQMVTIVGASGSLNPCHMSWLPNGLEISSLMSFFWPSFYVESPKFDLNSSNGEEQTLIINRTHPDLVHH